MGGERMGKKELLILVLFLSLFFPAPVRGEERWTVGPGHNYATISQAVEEAEPGDTILVAPGVYREKLVIQKPLTIEGMGGGEARIIGDERGNVITIQAKGVTLRHLTIEGSGKNYLDKDAAVLVEGDGAFIEENLFRNNLFGIYLMQSKGNIIRDNQFVGQKEKILSQRGNGIHLFYSHQNRIEGNRFSYVRDGIYFDFSHENIVTGNEISHSRYGVHYMWSNDNRFSKNFFHENVSGAAIMYSKNVTLTENIFQNHRGFGNFGLFLQTSEESTIEDNLFIDNREGLFADLSRANKIRENTFINNEVGIEFLGSNWDNVIAQNNFISNLTQALTNEGNGKNAWEEEGRGNYWDTMEGIDIEKDGVWDSAYHAGTLFDAWIMEKPQLKLFSQSPIATLINQLDRWFPIYDRPEIVDPYPLTAPVKSTIYAQFVKHEGDWKVGTLFFIFSSFMLFCSLRVVYGLGKRKEAKKVKGGDVHVEMVQGE